MKDGGDLLSVERLDTVMKMENPIGSIRSRENLSTYRGKQDPALSMTRPIKGVKVVGIGM